MSIDSRPYSHRTDLRVREGMRIAFLGIDFTNYDFSKYSDAIYMQGSEHRGLFDLRSVNVNKSRN